jgi:hypothetical protein
MSNFTQVESETYVRHNWSDPWQLVPFFDAEAVAFRVSPSFPTAELVWKFGKVMRRGELVASLIPPLQENFGELATPPLVGDFVKIVIAPHLPPSQQIKWYGVLVECETMFGGTSETERYGRQHWRAMGMEYLLARTLVTKTALRDATTAAEFVIPMALGFNLGAAHEGSHELAGNRLAGLQFEERYDVDLSGAKWTLFEMAKYLIEQFQPEDLLGNVTVPFKLAGGGSANNNMRSYAPITLQAEGRSVKECLDLICDRRRMLAWRCRPNDTDVDVIFHNLLDEPIDLPNNVSLIQNESQGSWNFDSDPSIRECRMIESEVSKADQVIVRGERATSTLTVTYSGSGLDKGWTAEEQTAYNAGASGEAGYAALDLLGKQEANQRARETGNLRKVFRRFINPSPNIPGGPVFVLAMAAVRYLDRLPLKAGIDYTGAIDDAKRKEHEESRADYRPPLALISSGGKYQFLDRPKSGSVATRPESGGRDWGAHVRMLDDVAGFEVTVHGEPAHVLAAPGEFAPVDAADTADVQPDMSWQNLVATVCAELHEYCEGVWPDSAFDAVNVAKRLYIHIAGARRDLLVSGTILDIDKSGNAITASNNDSVRDDAPRLQTLARIAYEWYRRPRRALHVVQHRIPSTLTGDALGRHITHLGPAGATQVDVGTMVTEIVYDIVKGTTSVKTDFAELDVTRL